MIEKMVINMALKSMKDNFLSLSDEEKQKKFCKLLDENQELKEKLNKYENPKDMTLMMMWCTEKVKDENEKLKKQLKEKEDYIKKLQATKDKLDKWDYENTLQQAKFIKYLEDEIKSCELVCNLIFNRNKDMKIYKEILQKYKKIIGGLDEKK